MGKVFVVVRELFAPKTSPICTASVAFPLQPFGAGHICSGTLISNFTVLTSASCLLRSGAADGSNEIFYRPDELRVVMGSLILTTDFPVFQATVLGVKTHGRFNQRTYLNNIAILDVSQ